jgi:ribulose-phosphate 3-epimerase
MARIIPAILARDEQEFRKRVATVAPLASCIQLDVLDGTLFGERSYSNAARIGDMHLSIPFEAHLMIANPETKVRDWIRAGASRVVVHREAPGNISEALEIIRLSDRTPGLAINPETDIRELDEFIPFVSYLLVMGVLPGAQGRLFKPETLGRVRSLKAAYPHLTIGVDGGVNARKHLAHELAVAGADDLIVGSAIWKSDDPVAAFKELVTDATIQ